MRLTLALLASCAYAFPIAAQAQAAPLADTLLRTAFALPAGVIVTGDALQLRDATVATSIDRSQEDASALHMRLGSSMLDYYPMEGQGFRVSAGLRLFARHNFLRDAERASGRRLSSPRGMPGFGSGIRRYTPAAMIGYNVQLGPEANVGLEGGAVAGRLDALAPLLDAERSTAGQQMHQRSGINPVVRTALAMRF